MYIKKPKKEKDIKRDRAIKFNIFIIIVHIFLIPLFIYGNAPAICYILAIVNLFITIIDLAVIWLGEEL